MVSDLTNSMDESGGNFNPLDNPAIPEVRVFNLKRDLPDGRDWPLAKLIVEPVALPSSDFHLRAIEPPIRNQASIGSCTGFGSTRAHRMARRLANQLPDPELSPLAQYYWEREAMGTVNQDSGASIRQSIQTLKDKGACEEAIWPYILQNWQTKPPPAADANALKDQAISYYSVGNDLTAIKTAIASGYVVTIGISVYTSFQGAAATSTGDIPDPAQGEALLGGHNIVLDTFDDAIGRFGFANSWGTSWGKAGFGTISYSYIQRLGFDGWVIQVVEAPSPVPDPTPVITVTISPASASVQAGTTKQFTANVPVTWSTNIGTIGPAGLFTAPSNTGSGVIQARSIADPTKFANASVTVIAAPPVPTTKKVVRVNTYSVTEAVYDDGSKKQNQTLPTGFDV